uniref:Uncharacterized protein n=1 Tax=Oryza brachyantha TaxID=4533 RepID=J3L092_ORYBR
MLVIRTFFLFLTNSDEPFLTFIYLIRILGFNWSLQRVNKTDNRLHCEILHEYKLGVSVLFLYS